MKISVNEPVEKIEYEIESKYGLLECTFYHESLDMHLFGVFSSFPEEDEYHKSFEYYKDRALEIFAEQFPKRLEELLEETVKEAEIRTLIEIKGISLEEAKRRMNDYLKDSEKKKKKRMNAPSSGRPPKSGREVLKDDVIEALRKCPSRLTPTLEFISKELGLASKEALGKKLKRHNLDWKELKKRT